MRHPRHSDTSLTREFQPVCASRCGTPEALRNGEFTPLSGPEPIFPQALHQCQITNRAGWIVETRGNVYAIARSELSEIIAYHWHPFGRATITTPDLHIGPDIAGTSQRVGPRHIHRMHFLTGEVALAAVVRLLIAEFGVTPLRADWRLALQ